MGFEFVFRVDGAGITDQGLGSGPTLDMGACCSQVPLTFIGYQQFYRGTPLIRNQPLLGPYGRPVSRAPSWSLGGGGGSYERSTLVSLLLKPATHLLLRCAEQE